VQGAIAGTIEITEEITEKNRRGEPVDVLRGRTA
jgi:hypothetical protein